MGFFLNPSMSSQGWLPGTYNRFSILTLVSTVEPDVKPCTGGAFVWVNGCTLLHM